MEGIKGMEENGMEKMEEIEYLQWLQSCYELPEKLKMQIWEKYPKPGRIFGITRECLAEFMTDRQLSILWNKLQETKGPEGMRRQFGRLKEQEISFVAITQEEYPELLREIADPPLGVYYRGKLPNPNTLAVALIGSRDCSEYGSHVAKMIGRALGERGVHVISGMARGIDGISQQAALEAGGESYGILGCGVDICYPQSNQGLYQKLIRQGGILSAYPPGTMPLKRNFPPRNRIVSGLSNAIVVVEAAIRSGTSITVSMALEQGREVYVVPGRITDRLSEGCNRLIKQGANLIVDLDGFIEELAENFFLQRIRPKAGDNCETGCRNSKDNAEKRHEKSVEEGLEPEYLELWRLLDDTPKTVTDIQAGMTNACSVQECMIRLMEMVLMGKAKQVSSGYFCRG